MHGQRTTLLEKMTTATWNVRGINQKIPEIIKEMENRNIDMLVVSETKKKGKGSEEIGDYIFLYSGVEREKRAASGVGIMLHKRLKSRILGYSWISDRIITLKFRTGRSHCNIIGVYAPSDGNKEEIQRFYKELQDSIDKVGKNDYMVILGDLNARVGNSVITNVMERRQKTIKHSS